MGATAPARAAEGPLKPGMLKQPWFAMGKRPCLVTKAAFLLGQGVSH